ncbi:MAG: hypothetical protein KC414_01420 [Romboutsia sp.]|nr:hypothetical protein [Romboutsia sp.]MCB9220928.1 hypothetical protein [Ignavibacteria bacterium]
MKIFLFTFFSLFSFIPVFAHKESTHQYIVREALKLLELDLGYTVTELHDWTGTTERNNHGVANGFYHGYIVSGAWNEDYYDVVYRQEAPPLSIIILDVLLLPIDYIILNPDCLKRLYRASLVSTTHFWDVDKGDDYLTSLDPLGINKLIRDKPNALQKAKKYAYGGFNFDYFNPVACNTNFIYNMRFDGLKEFYVNERIYVNSEYDYSYRGGKVNEFRDLCPWVKETFSYNILGRIAHLLADMSVPAHVHNDDHGTLQDPFENKMRYENADNDVFDLCDGGAIDFVEGHPDFVERWDYKSVYAEKGGIINPYCHPQGWNPIKYLMYTMAQITDHFASNRTSGDDNYEDIGEIRAQINDDINSAHPGPTISNNQEYAHSDADLEAIRDITIPYVIRATAGLLYWFANETNQLQLSNDECEEDLVVVPRNCEPWSLGGRNYIWQTEKNLTIKGCVNLLSPNTYETIDFTINGNAKNVKIIAGEEIKLEHGFNALEGSDVKIYISECNNCNANIGNN